MNLAINARDAMPHGGILTIRSGLRQITPPEGDRPDGPPLDSGPYAELVVVDSGTGIPPEALPNIFEPFFTTKDVGKGTGLGLATVHGIVTQSRGAVWAESTLGKGAAFHVLLPLAAAPDIPLAAAPGTTPAGESRGRVLVVEDEDHVRQLLVRMLTEAGFDVVQARHGGEALERLAEARGTVDVVLSDVVMPVMPGRKLALQLKQRYPGIPAIWMSGYPSESLTAEQFLPDGAPFLQKPVAPELLIETVRRILAQRPSVR
jgi:two-component system cell cycle sensor histidine kinase/response regulator CckA